MACVLSTEEYSQLLVELARKGKAEPDNFSLGGVVEALEQRVAAMLGKETAVWLPTGTLANHLAVRLVGRPKATSSGPGRKPPLQGLR